MKKIADLWSSSNSNLKKTGWKFSQYTDFSKFLIFFKENSTHYTSLIVYFRNNTLYLKIFNFCPFGSDFTFRGIDLNRSKVSGRMDISIPPDTFKGG